MTAVSYNRGCILLTFTISIARYRQIDNIEKISALFNVKLCESVMKQNIQ